MAGIPTTIVIYKPSELMTHEDGAARTDEQTGEPRVVEGSGQEVPFDPAAGMED